MNDQELIAAIGNLSARAASAGYPVACYNNTHFGGRIIPSAQDDFRIPRGFFCEENVPTGPNVGDFPTFRAVSLADHIKLLPEDWKMMKSIASRIEALRSNLTNP